MIRRKICMLGPTSVGKTSLVKRFVSNIFSERYLTTVGVAINKKVLEIEGVTTCLVIWDLQGEPEALDMAQNYLLGAAGYLLVVDGTRRSTLEQALELRRYSLDRIGRIPFVLLLNKADLDEDWELGDNVLSELRALGCHILATSAKTGQGVEEAFSLLAREIVSCDLSA